MSAKVRRENAKRAVKAYELKVTLRRVRPPVWRRIQIRSDTRLANLHQILQVVMGWQESHMHEFRRLGRQDKPGVRGTPVDRDDERTIRVGDLLEKPRDRMVYEYDFGDGWEHEVLLERATDHVTGARYPWVLGGARACPPEDVGGVGGYAHFLRAIRDPRHREHKEMLEWCGGAFDPASFDAHALNLAVHGGWAPGRADG